MMTNQEKPRRHEGSDEVRIGIPVTHGYPTAPPPCPRIPAASSGTCGAATLLPPTSSSSNGGGTTHYSCNVTDVVMALLYSIIYFSIFATFIMVIISLNGYPSFKVEGVTVVVHNSNNDSSASEYVAAQWNVGLSFSPGHLHKFNYNDLDVFLRSASDNNWTRTIIAPSSTENKTTSFKATANTLLHRSLQGLPLEFQVLIHVRFKDLGNPLQAICKNMVVGFSSSAIKGIMEGGPRSCSQ